MTEIPERLLKRAQAAREKAANEGGVATAVREDSDDMPPTPPNDSDSSDEVPEPKEPINLKKYWRPIAVTALCFIGPFVPFLFWWVLWTPWNFNYSFRVERWTGRNLYPENAFFWQLLMVGALFLLLAAISANRTPYREVGYNVYYNQRHQGAIKNRTMHYNPTWKTITVLSLVFLTVVGGFLNSWWNNKDVPRYYNNATVFAVSDVDAPHPQGTAQLFDGAKPGNNGCVLEGKHDVPSCIIEATFPTEGFEERSMSYSGAMTYMSQSSGTASNVDLLTETGAYLQSPNKPDSGYWTAIRDGNNIRTPIEGVVMWDGVAGAKPQICRFDGKYEMAKAFRGSRSNALANLIREEYSPYFYNLVDVYGTCVDHSGGDVEPVLYVPLLKEDRTGHRTVLAPAGLLEIRGDPSGDPQFTYRRSVTPADGIPGPVYPASIAKIQREQHTWAAGREHWRRGKFGFAPTTAKEQEGNPTDFFLKAEWDGRQYWVSQMTPRGASSQQLTGYFLIPADEVQNGELNTLTIYVLDDDDPRVFNLEPFINQVKQSIADTRPGFFSSGGVLTEFTPIADGKWVAYGLFGGFPSFKVRIDPADIRPVFEDYVVARGPGEVAGLEVCKKPIADLSKDELVMCAQGYVDALGQK